MPRRRATMRRSWRFGVAALLLSGAVAACTTRGKTGDQGPPGSPAPTEGTLAGVVTDGVTGGPLSAVTVTISRSGTVETTVTSAADGTFSATVNAGLLDVSFSKTFYTSPGNLQVAVNA